MNIMLTPTINVDGQKWIQRAGHLWGTYQTIASYIGYKSPASIANFAQRHSLTRLKHGKLTILRKDEIDNLTLDGSNL